jgi:hypothetical protein
MASTYSDLKIELIGTGDQTGTWGSTTNNNFSVAINEAITGSADVAFSSADVTITLTDTNAAQTARNLRLNLTGTSGGARNLILGSGCQIEKLYLVNNGLADAVTVKNTTGTGIAVPAGKSMFVYNNGTNVVEAVNATSSISTGAITCTSLTDSGLTSGRVTYAGTAGLLQDDADLTFDGTTLTAAGLSDSGNLTFTGTGNRITGDFSNGTVANRVIFQTSTTNGATTLTAIPNGTGTIAQIGCYDNAADLANSSTLQLDLRGASDARLSTSRTGTGTFLPLTMYTGGSERLRIDTSGNVGIGTSSPTRKLEVYGGASGTRTDIYASNAAGDFNCGVLTDNNGFISTSNASLFYTNSAERMRIDSSGNLLVGKTSSSTSSGVGVIVAGNGVVGSNRSGSTNTDTTYEVYSTGAGTFRFYVGMGGTVYATSTSISAISDQRLKENVRPLELGLAEVMALKPRRYDWKEGKGQDKKNAVGFVAQEFETVLPNSVGTSKAGEDGIEYKNINYEELVPTLVKAIQEQQALIENLTTRLNALEGK